MQIFRTHSMRRASLAAGCSALLIGWMLATTSLRAHDGPEETIAHLTAHIDEEGPTPRRLYLRATEYRALGRMELAVRDLKSALALHHDFIPALSELGRIYLALDQPKDSLATIDRTLALPTRAFERAGLHITRARALHALNRNTEALEACNQAFLESSPDPDRYLLRSEIQASLTAREARVQGLAEGFRLTGSAVLEEEWVEAMIDAGQFKTALERIEPRLTRSRWRSSWLLRKARVELGLDMGDAARKHLAEVVEEVNGRLNPERPDLFLLAERGLAHALLGDNAAASRDLVTAQKIGAQEWVVQRLRDALQ